jgi:hypothetical protein
VLVGMKLIQRSAIVKRTMRQVALLIHSAAMSIRGALFLLFSPIEKTAQLRKDILLIVPSS